MKYFERYRGHKKKEIDKCQSLFYINKCFGVLLFYPLNMVFSPTTNTATSAIEIVVMVNHTNTNILLSTILFGVLIFKEFKGL